MAKIHIGFVTILILVFGLLLCSCPKPEADTTKLVINTTPVKPVEAKPVPVVEEEKKLTISDLPQTVDGEPIYKHTALKYWMDFIHSDSELTEFLEDYSRWDIIEISGKATGRDSIARDTIICLDEKVNCYFTTEQEASLDNIQPDDNLVIRGYVSWITGLDAMPVLHRCKLIIEE